MCDPPWAIRSSWPVSAARAGTNCFVMSHLFVGRDEEVGKGALQSDFSVGGIRYDCSSPRVKTMPRDLRRRPGSFGSRVQRPAKEPAHRSLGLLDVLGAGQRRLTLGAPIMSRRAGNSSCPLLWPIRTSPRQMGRLPGLESDLGEFFRSVNQLTLRQPIPELLRPLWIGGHVAERTRGGGGNAERLS